VDNRHAGTPNPRRRSGTLHAMARPSPGVSGQLVDPDGRRWRLSRGRLDLRIVRRLFKDQNTPVLVGEAAGAQLRWISPEQRPRLLEQVRRCYAHPGHGRSSGCDIEYMGYEFTAPDGARLLYLEVWC
jgi:hypothetical protein